MVRLAGMFLFIAIAGIAGAWIVHSKVSGNSSVQKAVSDVTSQTLIQAEPTPTVTVTHPSNKMTLQPSRFVSQTFNNCGPASLSMIMSMFGRDVSQDELAEKMRPFNNPAGGVDDKSIFADEFVTYAKEYGFASLHRPNGSVDLIKKFIANDIPVVVRTWLHPNEDIGHFRIVRGFDDERGIIIQDDSYEGPNLEYPYETFLKMWKPFNYGYILVYPKEKELVVRKILGDEMQEQQAWEHARDRARKTIDENPEDGYALFNVAVANYYLGNYKTTVEYYEKSASYLPPRMLWYQLEPIIAYQKIRQYDAVFALTDAILQNGNLAYSELYFIRGEVFREQGRIDEAKMEFEKAVYYNKHFSKASNALNEISH